MNKEILEWINLKVKSCKEIKEMDYLPTAITDRSKKELKMLDLLKKELEEKDKLEQKRILNSRTEEPMEVPVLDDVERRYLKNVLKPFKANIKCIRKSSCIVKEGLEFICVYLENRKTLVFPAFKKDTMYKNMKAEKAYSLEELGIKYEKKE